MLEGDVDTLARRLFDALESGRGVPALTGEYPELDSDSAYEVQQALLSLHQKEAKRTVSARKVGLTSTPIQAQMGVDQPDYGVIFDEFIFETGTILSRSEYKMIAPRVEAELAFILEREITGPGISAVDVLAGTAAVVPVFEIIDSRIDGWNIKIADTIADNASGWGLVAGEVLTRPSGIDLRTVGLVMEREREVVATGAGAAVLGNPARAVAWLANTLSLYGESLPPGQPILSGSLTAAVEAVPGHYRACFGDRVGTVEVVIAP